MWRRMASGEVSAARMMISAIPLLRVLVHSLAPCVVIEVSLLHKRKEDEVCFAHLLQLPVVGGLLGEIEQLLLELLVCEWEGCVLVGHCRLCCKL